MEDVRHQTAASGRTNPNPGRATDLELVDAFNQAVDCLMLHVQLTRQNVERKMEESVPTAICLPTSVPATLEAGTPRSKALARF